MRLRLALLLLVGLLSTLGVGLVFGPLATLAADNEKAAEAQQYTCTMDPEVISDSPGRCPKCGMDLVPALTKQQKQQEAYPCLSGKQDSNTCSAKAAQNKSSESSDAAHGDHDTNIKGMSHGH